MNGYLSRIFIKIINLGYQHILHEKMTEDVWLFLRNMLYVGLGIVITSLFSFVFNIFGGRILGPSGYGEFALLYSISMFLHIPMIFGIITAMVKYTSEKSEFERNKKILSTAFILIFILTGISLVVYYFFQSYLTEILSVSVEMLYFSMILAVLYSFYTLSLNTLSSLHKMKKVAIFQPIYSIILIVAFLAFIIIGLKSYKSMIFSMFIAYGLTGLFIVSTLTKYIRFHFDRYWAKKIFEYGVFSLIGSLSFIVYTNIDKIMIKKFMSVADVGIYRAYIFSSETLAGMVLTVFIMVFFPTVSKYRDRIKIYYKINKLIPYLVLLGFPGLLLCQFIILKLFGGEYPIDLQLLVFFSIGGLLILITGFYTWLMNSIGKEGIKITTIGGIICAMTNISLNFILIPIIGIHGAIISTIMSFVINLFIISRGKIFL